VWETNLVNPDFCEYARLCGATGFSVRTPAELRPALLAALAQRDGPSLVEIHSSSTDV
jgi:thiamine pyrophosphate-dependent acetolactate synthase large subunit-like protein